MERLKELLQLHHINPSQVIRFKREDVVPLDLSRHNAPLAQIDLNDEFAFNQFIFGQLNTGKIGFGGYGEERGLYSRSDLFDGEEARTIHLGVDIWTASGTFVYAPLEGTVHSFDNHAVHGDYGPVIILKHQIEGFVFHSLYGHLSTDSLDGLSVGQFVKKGQVLAKVGAYHENFHWPPHLHFQLIIDMGEHMGDYPGVCKKSESQYYLSNCPDPELIIN